MAQPGAPIECTSSRVAPAADTLYAAGAGAAAGVSFYGASKCTGGGCSYYALGTVMTAVAITVALSAASGFQEAARCERARSLHQACITGDEPACLQLQDTSMTRGAWPFLAAGATGSGRP